MEEASKILNWNGCSGPHATNDVSTEGRILMSTNKGQTMMTNSQGTGFESKKNPDLNTIRSFLKALPGGHFTEDIIVNAGILWNPEDKLKGLIV